MSVLDCLSLLVKEGKITKAQEADARSIYDEIIQGEASRNMDAATAEGFAALKTAEALAASANAKKLSLARRATIYNANLDRINAHPKGPVAGFMALYDRDLHGQGGVNVTALKEDYRGRIGAKIHEMTEAYEPKAAGLKQDVTGIRSMISELFGVSTGDAFAARHAQAWTKATAWGIEQAQRLGKAFTPTEDWRLPQFWDSKRVNKIGRAEFISDVREEFGKGIEIHHPETSKLLGGDAREQILSDAAAHIMGDVSTKGGASTIFKDEMRVLRFKPGKAGADAYLKLMDKYGPGQGGYLGMMVGHTDRMSHELAMLHVMGPSPRAQSEALLQQAIQDNALRAQPKGWTVEKIGDALLRGIGLEGQAAAERLQKYMTGQLSGVGSDTVAGIFDGARSWIVASNMGSAVVTAVPTDSVNWLMAANYRGLNMGRMVNNVMGAFVAESADKSAMAARLGIVSHAVSRTAIGTKKFGDELLSRGVMSRMADFVVKAQGLQAWDKAVSRAWTMEFLASLGERSHIGFDELEDSFKSFFTSYGMTREDWGALTKGKLMEAGPARFLDPDSLDEGVRSKLMSAIYDERQFAYLGGGSNRVRALTTGGAKAGTPSGELARSFFMFKAFPITMLSTWGVRAAQDAARGEVGVAVQLGLFVTMAGALALQARQMLQGKDPRDMSSGWFWSEAAAQGGALGIYGDFLNNAFSRSGSTITETALGPLAAFPNAVGRLTSGARRTAEEGQNVNFGAALASDIQKFTPGSNIWFARLLLNRYVFDNVRKELDPDYATGFQRQVDQAQKQKQQFYWLPGADGPSRGPNLGAAFGGS